jgi:GGDEF domain-containing protein
MLVPDPAEPLRVQDLGIPPSLVIDITVRRILREGQTTTMRLAQRMRISPVLADQVIEKLRHDRLIEIQGAEGRSYVLQLSEPGRTLARERMDASKYTGAMPVSLAEYTDVVTAQHHRPDINRDSIRESFKDLVISDELLDELGPAIHTPGAIFLYGPPGTGKTSIAERMINTNKDSVLIPHAVEVDGQVVTVYDPMMHEAIEPQPERLDRRWVRCKRPSVIVGGEMQSNQLDLNHQSEAGVYLAPLQMLANNGVLTIDDFGRQSLTPEQLLNRWIVPLDRDVDFLTLDYGAKFEVPFLTKIVFATNLDPSRLADEAFYRRIGSKILIPSIGDDAFDEVLRRVAAARKITVQPEAAALLRKGSREMGDGDLRPYLPGAIATLITSIASYEGIAPVMDRKMVERALVMFFSRERDMRGSKGPEYTGPMGTPQQLSQGSSTDQAPTMSGANDVGPSSDGSSEALDAILGSTEDLLWVKSPGQAREVSADLINRLGLSVAAPDATGPDVYDIDLSFGVGDRLVIQRPQDPTLQKLLDEQLPRFASAGARSLQLTAGQNLLVDDLSIDPVTGLSTGNEASRLIGRLGEDDVLVLLEIDVDGPGRSAENTEKLNAEFGKLLRTEVRSRDRCGYLGNGRFMVVILGGVEQEPEQVLGRLRKAWVEARPGVESFSAGFARSGSAPKMALVAAGHALLRATQAGGDGWVAATDADFE